MANTYFDPGPKRAEKVRELFSAVAARYDLVNDLQSFGLHRYWKDRLIRLSRPAPGEEALDVCCGTGDLALRLAKRGLLVTGLDFSQHMLQVAQARARGLPLQSAPGQESRVSTPEHTKIGHPAADQIPGPKLEFVQGDALQLPFSDAQFHIVTVAYGLRNLADWRKGLTEMRRVARPGGRVLVLDFARPPNPLWRALYFVYLRTVVPVLGLICSGSAGAYSYILESLRHYPDPETLAEHMHGIGLVNVQVIRLLGGVMTIHYGEKIQAAIVQAGGK